MHLHLSPLLLPLVAFLATSLTLPQPQHPCTSCAPNPIATTYPNNATGTINGTIGIVPVPIAYARSLLPSHLSSRILAHAYTRFSIPPTHYPLIIAGVIDHDIRFQNINAVSDFSSFRISFPFIDLLGDGSSCFAYNSYIYLPPTVPVAITGALAYGEGVLNATFDPPDAPYKSVPGATQSGEIIYKVYDAVTQKFAAALDYKPCGGKDGYPLALYKNITNQPTFGNNTAVCDNQINFWNTSVTTGKNIPVDILGNVNVGPPLVPKQQTFTDVKGVKATRAFLENNYIPCQQLKGYKGTGSGDSG